MKSTLRPLGLVVVSLCAAAVARVSGQVQVAPPMISVSGSAEIRVAPDEAVLNVGIETRDPVLLNAQKENDERAARALKFLRDQGVAEADIRTDFVHIETYYDHGKTRLAVEGYHARKSMQVLIRKLEKFEAILGGLLANGANGIGGVTFRTSELRKHRDHARQLAIRAAREKADALAAELGVRRGKVHQIYEQLGGGFGGGSGSWNSAMHNSAVTVGSANEEIVEGTVSLGQISVSATVHVTFLLE